MISLSFFLALFGFLQNAASTPLTNTSPINPKLEIHYAEGLQYTMEEDRPWLFENRVEEVCNTGVWMIYGEENYNATPSVRILPKLEGACHPGFPRVSSARAAGLRLDNSIPSVTFFRDIRLQGTKFVFQERVSNIEFSVKSLVTIGSTVQFYRETNYNGDTFCLDLGTNYCVDGVVCWVWNWDLFFTPWDPSLAKSARTGCTSEAQVFGPKPIPSNYDVTISG